MSDKTHEILGAVFYTLAEMYERVEIGTAFRAAEKRTLIKEAARQIAGNARSFVIRPDRLDCPRALVTLGLATSNVLYGGGYDYAAYRAAEQAVKTEAIYRTICSRTRADRQAARIERVRAEQEEIAKSLSSAVQAEADRSVDAPEVNRPEQAMPEDKQEGNVHRRIREEAERRMHEVPGLAGFAVCPRCACIFYWPQGHTTLAGIKCCRRC